MQGDPPRVARSLGPRRPLRHGAVLLLSLLASSGCMEESSLSYVRRHLNAGDLAEPRAAPTGELTDREGRPFDLGGALSGRLGYVFFGYTSCPDMCPLTMSALGRGLDLLPDSARRRVLPIFISLDPARDTPERMAMWLSNFGPDFVGLTGSEATLEDVLGQMGYRLPPQVIPDEGPYEVAHPPDLFVVTPDGMVRFGYRGEIEPQWIAADAQALLAVDWGVRTPARAGRERLIRIRDRRRPRSRRR